MSELNLSMIEKMASEQFETPEEIQAFMEGFKKEAALFPSSVARRFQAGVIRELPKVALGMGAALTGAAIVKSINVATQAVDNHSTRNKFEMALAQVMANNRVIRNSPPERAKAYAETIYKFSPSVAADPNLLGYILASAVLGEGGLDTTTIKSLVDLEARHRENQSSSPLIGIKH